MLNYLQDSLEIIIKHSDISREATKSYVHIVIVRIVEMFRQAMKKKKRAKYESSQNNLDFTDVI